MPRQNSAEEIGEEENSEAVWSEADGSEVGGKHCLFHTVNCSICSLLKCFSAVLNGSYLP